MIKALEELATRSKFVKTLDSAGHKMKMPTAQKTSADVVETVKAPRDGLHFFVVVAPTRL